MRCNSDVLLRAVIGLGGLNAFTVYAEEIQVLPGTAVQSINLEMIDLEASVSSCPGGSCACTRITRSGGQETVKACCPEDKSPSCLCTPLMTTTSCHKDAEVEEMNASSGVHGTPELHFEALLDEKESLFPIALPYSGLGGVYTVGGKMVIRFGDPDETDPYNYEAVSFSYGTEYEFSRRGELYVDLTRDGQMYIRVHGTEMSLDFALTDKGVLDWHHFMPDIVERGDESRASIGITRFSFEDGSLLSAEDCDGGYCSCTEGSQRAEACCPIGKTPQCRCSEESSSATCVYDATLYAFVALAELQVIDEGEATITRNPAMVSEETDESITAMGEVLPVTVPYSGPGIVVANDHEITVRFGDPDETDPESYEAVTFSLTTSDEFFFARDEIYVDLTADGKLLIDVGDTAFDLNFTVDDRESSDGTTATAIAEEFVDSWDVSEFDDPPLEEENSCPGGSCECSGPKGSASACCPKGKTPRCSCTSNGSISNCTQEATEFELDVFRVEF